MVPSHGVEPRLLDRLMEAFDRRALRCVRAYVQQLRGLSRSFDTLSGDGFDEEAFEAGLTSRHHSTMRCWYWIFKMQSRFMCGAYEQAREAGDKAAELSWSSVGHIQLLDFHLYRALTLAACGFTVAVLSGIALLSTNGSEYVGNPFLELKLTAIALGLANIVAAQFLPAWRARATEPHGPRQRFTLRVLGATSLVCWLGAVAAGRMIGYW